jgi:pimeloyl-ACP methyl ester carboxylesterase
MSAWILLRGLTREAGHWGGFAHAFASALGDARVVALDLPGNGSLYRERSTDTVEQSVESCRAELQRRGLPPPFCVLALSLGAMAAVAWAARYPAEVQRCVLLNTSLRPFSPFYRRLRPASYPDLACALRTADVAKRERVILRMTSRRFVDDATVVNDWIALQHARPIARTNAMRQLAAAIRYRAPVARPQAEILMLASRDDRLVDVRCSREIAQAWRVPLVEHPSAGHDLPLDDPAWVIEQVRAWLGEAPGAGAPAS